MTATVVTPKPPAGPNLGKVGRGSVLNLVGAGFSAVANVVVLIVLTRGFGKTDAGLIYTATSVFLVLEAVGRGGADVSLVYFISRQRALFGGVRRGTVGHALRPVAALTCAMSVLLLLFARPLGNLIDAGPHSATYMRILALFVPAASLSQVILGASRGLGSMKPTVAIDRLGRALVQLVLVAVAAVVGSASFAILGWSLPYLPAAVLAMVWFLRSVGRPAEDAPPMTGREFWRFTAPRALATVSQVILQRLDIVLVAALRSPADAAVYAAATRFLVVGQLGVQALSNAVQPPLSSALATGDLRTARTLYQTSTAWLVLLVWPMLLGSLVFSGLILRVFGHGYGAGSTTMIIIALSMMLATGCGFVDIVLVMAGRSGYSLANTLGALVVNVVLNLLLIPHLGLTGAALSWSVAIAINNLAPLIQVRRSMGLHPFGRGTALAAGLNALLFGVVPGVVVLGTGSYVLGLLAVIPAAVAYLLLVKQSATTLGLDAIFRRRSSTPRVQLRPGTLES